MFEILQWKTTLDRPLPGEDDDDVFPRTLIHVFVHIFGPWLPLFAVFSDRYGPRVMMVDRRWGRGPPCSFNPNLQILHWENEWMDGISGGEGFWKHPVTGSYGITL
jgi:hypothetical protein